MSGPLQHLPPVLTIPAIIVPIKHICHKVARAQWCSKSVRSDLKKERKEDYSLRHHEPVDSQTDIPDALSYESRASNQHRTLKGRGMST